MITVLIFLAVLFVLILVHEWGHYIVAKFTGMRVDEFAIGFPPRLFAWKRGETEYSLNALPLGGYVRIYGEDPTALGDDPNNKRAFGARSKWAQALVLLAGVTMNWIFAWFLLVIIMLVGVPTQIDESAATNNSVVYIASILPGSPADSLLPSQSKIMKVKSGEEVLSPILPSTLSDFVAARAGEAIDITYQNSDGGEDTVSIIPQIGVIESSPERAALGISSMTLVETIKKPFGAAVVDAGVQTYTMTKTIIVGFGMLLTGQVSLNQVSGPVGIAVIVGDAAAIGLTTLLYLTAFISVNLAVVNLLPIPALDGGRLVFVAIETIIRRPIPAVWAMRVNLVGFASLLLLMLLATVSDVSKFF